MDLENVKSFVEEIPELRQRQMVLSQRFIEEAGNDILQDESLIQRLEEVDEKLDQFDSLIYESGVLTDKEILAVELRSLGYTYQKIGEVFSLTSREGVRSLLNKAYEKLVISD